MGKRVMIVEDDFIIRMFIEKVVIDCGFIVVGKASKYNEAIKKAVEIKPDLILMDIGLNDEKDGIDAVEEIHKFVPDLKVIFLTGNSDGRTKEKANKVNPLGFIFKPINDEILKVQMMKLIELK